MCFHPFKNKKKKGGGALVQWTEPERIYAFEERESVARVVLSSIGSHFSLHSLLAIRCVFFGRSYRFTISFFFFIHSFSFAFSSENIRSWRWTWYTLYDMLYALSILYFYLRIYLFSWVIRCEKEYRIYHLYVYGLCCRSAHADFSSIFLFSLEFWPQIVIEWWVQCYRILLRQ